MLLMAAQTVYAAPIYVGDADGVTYDVSGSETYDVVNVGSNANSIGTVNVGAGDTLTSDGVAFFGANDGGVSYINITDGGILNTAGAWMGVYGNSDSHTLVTGSGSQWLNADGIALSSNNTGEASLTVSEGAYVSTNRLGIGAASWVFGGAGTGTADLLVTGAGTVVESYYGLDLGTYDSAGTATISDGAKIVLGAGTGGLYMAEKGTLSVSGPDTTMIIQGDLNPTSWFYMSGGTAEFADGASIITDGGYIGGGTTDEATLTVSGGTNWDAEVRVFVGGNTGGLVNDGAGVLNVTGGSTITTATLGVGLDDSSVGSVVISGEGSSISVPANAELGTLGNIYVSVSGDANLLVTENASLSSGNSIRIGYNAGGTGTLAIGAAYGSEAAAAGSVITPAVEFGDGDGSLVFNHTDEGYDFTADITGAGAVGLYSGTTSFTGDLSAYTGKLTVDTATLLIADGNTVTLGGDYEQTATGVLRVGSSAGDSFGKLVVGGTATFAEDTTIVIDVADLNTLAAGDILPDVVSAGTLNAATIRLTDNSELFTFYLTPEGNSMDIEIVRGVTVEESLSTEGFGVGIGAARVWDSIIEAGTTGTDMDDVVTALGHMNSSEEVRSAIAQTLPVLISGTSEISTRNLQAINQAIMIRQSSFRDYSFAGSAETDKNLWVRPVGSWAHQNSQDGVSGYDSDSYGFVAGIDGEVSRDNRMGFAFSYLKSSLDGRDSASDNHADIDTFQVAAYGSYEVIEHDVDWQIDAGMNKNDTERDIDFMGRRATADYSSYFTHFGIGMGKAVYLGESTAVTPSLRTDFTYVKDESYTESGADSLNLKVDGSSSKDLTVMLRTVLSHNAGSKVKLAANAGLGYDFLNQRQTLRASYMGGGNSFTTRGIDHSPWLGQLGVGVALRTSETTMIGIDYDLERRDGFHAQTASAKLQLMF